MKHLRTLQVLFSAAFVLLNPVGALAQEAEALTREIKELRQKLDELEERARALEARGKGGTNVLTKTASNEKLTKSPETRDLTTQPRATQLSQLAELSLGEEGLVIRSADQNFLFRLGGMVQVDSRTFFSDGGIVGNDNLLIRRARPIFQGTVLRDFDFYLLPELGGVGAPQLLDGYLNYTFQPWLQLQAGKYKVPVGLEQLQRDSLIFFNERALPSSLTPNRDVGIELHGDLFGGTASYAVGLFNGVGDARFSSNVDFEDDKEFVGRVFFQPFKNVAGSRLDGLGFGVAGTYEDMQGTNSTALPSSIGGTLPGYFTDGQQQFFAYNPVNTTSNRATVIASGAHWRLSPQAYYFHGPLGFMGEYVVSDQGVARVGSTPAAARLEHRAWQISGSWVLTGEDATFANGVLPRKSFRPLEGGWGAWQLVARYAVLDIDRAAFPLFSDPGTSARSAAAWSLGLNGYLNRNVLFKTSFSHTDFQGGGRAGTLPPANVTRKDENVLFTRLQLSF